MSDDVYGLTGAHALDALDELERRRVESAAAGDPELAAELGSLREAAALLADAAAMTPPAGMRAAVLARVDAVAQDRPIVRPAPSPAAARGRRDWLTALSLGAAAVAAAVAVGLGALVLQLGTRVGEVEAAGQQVAAVVAADDARRVTAALPGGGRVSAVVSAEQGIAVVVGDDLAAVGEDRMYALWAIVDGQPQPVGELGEGRAATVAGAPLDAVGLTVEPRGPLTAPTGEIIALLEA
jgi:hypothetical protein